MGILDTILGGGLGSLVKSVVGTFKLSPEDRLKFEQAIADNEHELKKLEFDLEKKAMEATQSVVDAQKSIIVAEMAQGDIYTKRARPTLVYAGLGFIFLNNVFTPMTAFFSGRAIPELSLPSEFWAAWAGVVGIWSLGRTFERRGAQNKVVQTLTGNSFK